MSKHSYFSNIRAKKMVGSDKQAQNSKEYQTVFLFSINLFLLPANLEISNTVHLIFDCLAKTKTKSNIKQVSPEIIDTFCKNKLSFDAANVASF